MRVAAYQAPLLASGSMDAIELIARRVKWCEAEGAEILCCPEAVLGGLADYSENPFLYAISADSLASVLAPIASEFVTTIVGFTELSEGGALYNSAAVFQGGRVLGLYRKVHPAIRRTVYAAGCELPVFEVGALKFGIVICNDSNYPELARGMASEGATVLLVPTNNGLPVARGGASELVMEARNVDIATAIENRMWVIRADVAGATDALVSHGSSGIVDCGGNVVKAAATLQEDLIVAEIR